MFGASLFALCASAAPGNAQDISASTTAAIHGLLIAASAPAISMPVWTSRPDSAPSYRRNPTVWTGAAISLTGKAAWNSFTGTCGTTAISPRHVVYAEHVKGLYPSGTTVRFVTDRDEAVERTVISSVRIGSTDIDLSTLDRPLPETIHWFKVMPAHWFLKCARRAPGTVGGLPCVVMDANTQSVSLADLAGFYSSGFATEPPADSLRLSFARTLYRGDSGSPMFLLLGSELVLDGIFGVVRGGSEISSHIAALDAAMQGSGCQVTVADLTAFASR